MTRTRTMIAAGTTSLAVVAGPVAAAASAGATASPSQAAASARTGFTPGAAGLGDPYYPLAGNGGYDAGHYDLRLAYDPGSGVLSGRAAMRARATQNLSRFDLDLSGLTVSSVQVDGRAAAFSRRGQELVVTPARGLRSGCTFSVVVRYAGVPAAVTDPDGSTEGWVRTPDGAFVVGEPVGAMSWFPSDNAPSDKATYDLRMTVPKGISVWGNGVLRSRAGHGGTTTYWWQQRQPISTYLVTSTLGRFDRRTGRTRHGLPVYLAVDPVVKGTPWTTLRRTAEVTDWEAAQFGPYPFSATGGVVDDAATVGYSLETRDEADVRPGAGSADHRPRAGPPVVRRLGDAAHLAGHLAQRGVRDLRRVAVGRAPRRPDGGGGAHPAARPVPGLRPVLDDASGRPRQCGEDLRHGGLRARRDGPGGAAPADR